MTRDQFICEMMGKCWHEWTNKDSPEAAARKGDGRQCKKCGIAIDDPNRTSNPSYSTSPADILALQQLVMGAEWWGKFYWWIYDKSGLIGPSEAVQWLFSDHNHFADLVAEFRGYRPDEVGVKHG